PAAGLLPLREALRDVLAGARAQEAHEGPALGVERVRALGIGFEQARGVALEQLAQSEGQLRPAQRLEARGRHHAADDELALLQAVDALSAVALGQALRVPARHRG